MEEKYYWLGFSYFSGVGPKRFKLLLSEFKSAKNAWNANKEDLAFVIGELYADNFIQFKKNFSFQKETELLKRKKIEFITLQEKEYPQLLKKNQNSPFLLYVMGNISILNRSKTIAVVGTRKITQYGKDITRMLTQGLVENGFVIVSGLAFGVDANAHLTTLENNGETIAVLGCGVDCCAPVNNQYIYDQILDRGGTIVSSFRPGEKATKGSFPARNAIIAGLSLGVLVTEGAADSGSLITARDAQKLERPIFAVPGPITSSLSKGSNSLLQKGAIAVISADDILKSLNIQKIKINQKSVEAGIAGSYDEIIIINALKSGPLHFDEIVRKLGKETKLVSGLLSLMEIKGYISLNRDGKYYKN